MEDIENEIQDKSRVDIFLDAGRPITAFTASSLFVEHLIEPFESIYDYNLASWFIRSNVTKTSINNYFKHGLGRAEGSSFTSAYKLNNQIELMEQEQGIPFIRNLIDFGIDGAEPLEFFSRNPIDCVTYVLRQLSLASRMIWALSKYFNEDSNRVYTEMHTADWWWEKQVIQIKSIDRSCLTSYRSFRIEEILLFL